MLVYVSVNSDNKKNYRDDYRLTWLVVYVCMCAVDLYNIMHFESIVCYVPMRPSLWLITVRLFLKILWIFVFVSYICPSILVIKTNKLWAHHLIVVLISRLVACCVLWWAYFKYVWSNCKYVWLLEIRKNSRKPFCVSKTQRRVKSINLSQSITQW